MHYFDRKAGGWPRPAALGLIAGLILAGCAGDAPPSQAGVTAEAEPPRYSPLGSYLASRHAERTRDYESASTFVTNVLKSDPDNFELLGRAHLLLLADGRFDEAVAVAKRIARLSTANPQANLTLAIAEVRDGDLAGAEARLEGMPLVGTNRVVLPLTRAWIQVAEGRPAAALNTLRALDEIEGFKPLYEYHAALINDLTGRPEIAENHYRRALQGESAPSLRLVEAAGNFLERRGQRDAARQMYGRVGAPFAESVMIAAAVARVEANAPPPPPLIATPIVGLAEGLFNVAGALRQESGGQIALIYGRLALALDPDRPAGLLLVADILDVAGRVSESNALFARVPRDSPLSWSARLRIAENLQQMGDTDGAIKQLQQMSEERVDRVDALVTLGQLLRFKERFAEAARAFDTAIARLPAVEPRHWTLFYSRGIAHERSKQWARAEADFLRALELQPEQPDVLNYLAYSWVEQGVNYDRALKMLERAVELRPNSGHIIDSMGWVLFRLGRYDDAVPYLERAVELMPEDPVVLDHLGDAYWRVGRLAEARFQWQRALRNKPEPNLRVEIEHKLERGLAARNSRSGF